MLLVGGGHLGLLPLTGLRVNFLAGLGGDRRADMPGHDDRRVDVRRVRAELDVQRLREALHGELGRGVRGVLGALGA